MPCPGSCPKWAQVPQWECQGSQVTPAQHALCMSALEGALGLQHVVPGAKAMQGARSSNVVCLLAPKAYYFLACRRQAEICVCGWARACTIGCLAAELHDVGERLEHNHPPRTARHLFVGHNIHYEMD